MVVVVLPCYYGSHILMGHYLNTLTTLVQLVTPRGDTAKGVRKERTMWTHDCGCRFYSSVCRSLCLWRHWDPHVIYTISLFSLYSSRPLYHLTFSIFRPTTHFNHTINVFLSPHPFACQ